MKKVYISFIYLLLFLVPFGLQSQIIQNIGFGTGFYETEPTIKTNSQGEEYFVGGVDIQYVNLSYEPRFMILDSIVKQFSISAGLPIEIGFSENMRNGVTLGNGTFQAATIGYLNWGNGTFYKNLYTRKLGLSIGFGMSYIHSRIFKRKVNIELPKNDLIKPVVAIGFRHKSKENLLAELNCMLRLGKDYEIETCEIVPFWEFLDCQSKVYREMGWTIQVKLFFAQ